MEAHYVTFEQAKLLKELGFNVPTISSFDLDGEFSDTDDKTPFDINTKGEHGYSRPEQHQVVEWLRINRGIWISVKKSDGFQNLFFYSIVGSNGFNGGHPIETIEWDDDQIEKEGYNNKYFSKPSEAYSAAFDYILPTLIK